MIYNIILFILLQEGISIISYYGVALTAVMTLLSFLLRDAYLRLTKRVENLESENAALREDNSNIRLDFETKINNLNVNILNRLDDIKDKFNEFRK